MVFVSGLKSIQRMTRRFWEVDVILKQSSSLKNIRHSGQMQIIGCSLYEHYQLSRMAGEEIASFTAHPRGLDLRPTLRSLRSLQEINQISQSSNLLYTLTTNNQSPTSPLSNFQAKKPLNLSHEPLYGKTSKKFTIPPCAGRGDMVYYAA